MTTVIEHTSRKRDYSSEGKQHTYTVLGDCDTIFALQEGTYAIGKRIAGMGIVKNTSLSQKGGKIWALEITCNENGGDENDVEEPDTSWGVRSASLDGSMLSVPLETTEGYRTQWDHYLFAHPDIDDLPDWWETATDPILDKDQSRCYAWGLSINDLPVINDRKWKILKNPTKPGTNSRDVGVYTVTETARFKTSYDAGQMVDGMLNKIGSPYVTFGISGGNWKCDHASVSWQNGYWLATLTWTRSGNDKGWDRDLYP